MATSTFSAAKRLCYTSDWSISNLELQKLLYIAPMVCLGQKDVPLITGHFEAWNYGPVEPNLYRKTKIFGSSPVGNIFHAVEDVSPGYQCELLDDVVEQLAQAPPGKLIAITHWDKGAWAKHYYPGVRHALIPNEDIRQEYLDRVNVVGK